MIFTCKNSVLHHGFGLEQFRMRILPDRVAVEVENDLEKWTDPPWLDNLNIFKYMVRQLCTIHFRISMI